VEGPHAKPGMYLASPAPRITSETGIKQMGAVDGVDFALLLGVLPVPFG
jgi:hypothetical protein